MMKKFLFLLLILCLTATFCRAQDDGWDQFAQEYLDESTDDDEVGLTLYDELLELHRQPLNINRAQREDLLRMPFLSEAQADSIINMVRRLRGMISMNELMFVRNLEYKQRKYLALFFYCPADRHYYDRDFPRDSLHRRQGSSPAIGRVDLRGLKTDISSTFGVPLYRREGFRSHTREELDKNPNRQYLGNSVATTLRYRASLNNRLSWGLTAQKDEGEPFAEGKNWLYDSYSAYLAGKGRGTVRQWVLGDFIAHFGLGLTIGAARPDAANIISSLRPRQEGIRAHTSADEALFLRGGAIDINIGKFQLLAFASWCQLDATLSGDSISTIITSGYHRTQLEMSKRNNISALQGGASLGAEVGPAKLSLNIAHTHYDTPYRRPTALYRKHYFHGRDFGNYSLSYAISKAPFGLWGEVATSRQGGVAIQHRAQYVPHYRLSFHLLHRYYSTHYLSPLAQGYRIGSLIQNEHGLLLGATWRPVEKLQLKAYIDYAHFPFAVYASTNPKDALTAQLQAEYIPHDGATLLLRYKVRARPDDDISGQPSTKTQHFLRAQYRLAASERISLTSTAEMTLLSQPDKSNTRGWLIAQTGSAKILRQSSIGGSLSLFHTDSYAEALRLYEPTLLYSSAFPTLYYHGWRLSASAQHQIGPLHLAVKYVLTHYTNRQTIGSGLRQYNGSTLQDLLIQLALRF